MGLNRVIRAFEGQTKAPERLDRAPKKHTEASQAASEAI